MNITHPPEARTQDRQTLRPFEGNEFTDLTSGTTEPPSPVRFSTIARLNNTTTLSQ